MVRALLLLAALALAGRAAAFDAPLEDWTLEIVPEPVGETLHAGEMIVVRLRGVYGASIALESLEAPHIGDFSWVQLGHDLWANERIDGLTRRTFERRYAMWPERAGTLTIPAFTHELTLAATPGKREPFAVTAAPATLEVSPPPTPAADWLPLRGLTVEEAWSGPTDALEIGEVVIRTVTLTAYGITPDRMPTIPSLDTDAIFAFPEDEARSVEITPGGPVSTIVWRWSILPETPAPALIPPLRLAWWDAAAREPREAVLPARRLAVTGAVFGVEERDGALERAAHFARPAGFALGLFCGLAVAAGAARRRGLTAARLGGMIVGTVGRTTRRAARPFERLAARARLGAATRNGDARGARRAALALLEAGGRVDPAALAALDRLAFGPDPLDRAALAAAGRRAASLQVWAESGAQPGGKTGRASADSALSPAK